VIGYASSERLRQLPSTSKTMIAGNLVIKNPLPLLNEPARPPCRHALQGIGLHPHSRTTEALSDGSRGQKIILQEISMPLSAQGIYHNRRRGQYSGDPRHPKASSRGAFAIRASEAMLLVTIYSLVACPQAILPR
jgi:hypothetical protein